MKGSWKLDRLETWRLGELQRGGAPRRQPVNGFVARWMSLSLLNEVPLPCGIYLALFYQIKRQPFTVDQENQDVVCESKRPAHEYPDLTRLEACEIVLLLLWEVELWKYIQQKG